VLPWYVYFFILYIIIFLPGLIVPVFPVSMTLIVYYLTCMYKLFYLLVFWSGCCNGLLCTFSVVYCHFCICWSALLSLGLACCVVWSGGFLRWVLLLSSLISSSSCFFVGVGVYLWTIYGCVVSKRVVSYCLLASLDGL